MVARSLRAHLASNYSVPNSDALDRFNEAFAILDRAYPEDDLGNRSNPLDELIYIVLSRRTREAQYQSVFRQLVREFRPWRRLLAADFRQVQKVLTPLGLQRQLANHLRQLLRAIVRDHGRPSLAALSGASYSDAYHYLRSLPGVNDKTAKCVMLYSLGLPALPVDTHTFRVSTRLGLLVQGTSAYRAPAALEAVVPRPQRRRFHVLTVLHGREYCRSKPRCAECPLCNICPSASHD